ncbi:MAG: aminopeptidase [Chloroflexota bacterium]|nr:aminopeptidase [Chloroflexota bacterium]
MPATDPRWKTVADVLVHYSAAVQPGERVMIAMSEIETFPLAQAVYESCIKAGAYPQAQLLSEKLRHSLLQHGSAEQHSWLPEIEAYGMAWADVYFGLRGAYDLRLHDDIPAGTLAANQAALGKISTLRWQETRWCLVRVPNAELARQADTDLATIEDMFFAACLMDYPAASQQWHRQAARLEGSETLRIVAGDETDLAFSVRGRQWKVFDGKINLPDGEIYTAPVNKTLNGRIHFELPGVLGGQQAHDIRLAWEDGRLSHASASTNEDFLRRILETDAGASRLGEFAFGMNPYVNRFCKDILIDEKIGGTIHLALGRAYPECGGVNQSSIHWDLVKDLRQSGSVFVDGVPVLADGKMLI